MQEPLSKFVHVRQFKPEDIQMYYNRFIELLDVTESIWGPLTPATMKGKPSGDQDKARNKFLACLFLSGASGQHESAITDLNNDFIQGNQDAYCTPTSNSTGERVSDRSSRHP